MITPEWVVALVAIGGILFHIGYSWNTLNYLKENAATKTDLKLLETRFVVKDDCDTEHDNTRDEIAALRVQQAHQLGMIRALENKAMHHE